MKFLAVIFFSLFIISESFAQQDFQYSHQHFLSSAYNPAYAGSSGVLAAGADFRVQWLGITGQPITQLLYVHTPFEKMKGGVGVVITNDFAGAHRATALDLQYAYQKKMSFGIINFGVQAGLIQYSLQGNKLRAPDGVYLNDLNHNDTKLPITATNAISPDLGVGIKVNIKKLITGVSVAHVFTLPLKFQSPQGDEATYKYTPTLYYNANYPITLNYKLDLIPSLLLKSDFKKTNLDLNALVSYQKIMMAGLAFRGFSKNSIDAVAIILGYKINDKFFLVYSYDLTLSKLIRASTGSHELSIHYKMKPPKPPARGKIIYCPRFL